MGSYNHVKTTTSSSTYESDSVRTLTTGYRYDAKKIMLYAEWGLREGGNADIIPANENPRGIAEKFNKRTSAGYVTAGYWFGNVLPHITASQTKWNTGTVTGTQDMYSLGVNVKVEEGVMFKTNVSYSISNNGPAHMETEGDATTAVAGFDVVF
jgi:predicted porin